MYFSCEIPSMERELVLVNERTRKGAPSWDSFTYGVAIPPQSELNSTSDCFLNPNWDSSMDQNDPFESALSSLVSSPAACNADAGDGFVFGELIGKLGSIYNSGEISPQSCNIGSTNTSSYNTPLNSPPKLNLSSVMEIQIPGTYAACGGQNQLPSHLGLAPLNGDPGFVERPAKFSCFGSRNLAVLCGSQFGSEMGYGSLPKLEPGNLSRVSSSQCINVAGSQLGAQEIVNSEKNFNRISLENGDVGDSREGSSVSEQIPAGESGAKAQNNTNSRKRKATSKAKGSVREEKIVKDNDESSSAKRSKTDEDAKKEKVESANANTNAEQSGNGKDSTKHADQKQNKKTAKPPEPPKGYIYVRAIKGQATDSHSLAERVRREKIGKRMKFLQDLVPGCNKVTGKAVVLDEIINYVQSLQRQVEFLSMKLATVNPRMDFNMEALLSKDIVQLPPTMFPLDSSAQMFPYGFQSQQIPTPPNGLHNGTETPFSVNPLDTAVRQNPGIQSPSINGFSNSAPQIPTFWEDDLHSIVQMGFPQNQMQNSQGTTPNTKHPNEN